MRKIILCAACVPLLGLTACATTSFAPPRLKYDMDFEYVGQADRVNYGCAKPDLAGRRPTPISRSVGGAHKMIDNFVLTYRCAAHSAADGRQWFEVPSFLVVAGAATAAAFGAGADVAIAAGAANAVLTGGKDYYVPEDKAAALDRALDALLCIKTESVGVDAYAIAKQGEAQQGEKRNKAGGPEGSVSISVDEQYFEMVAAALFSVERVTARNLSGLGNFNPAGVAAQIREAAEAARQAEQNKRAKNFALDDPRYATLELASLRPKLQDCVLRATV